MTIANILALFIDFFVWHTQAIWWPSFYGFKSLILRNKKLNLGGGDGFLLQSGASNLWVFVFGAHCKCSQLQNIYQLVFEYGVLTV